MWEILVSVVLNLKDIAPYIKDFWTKKIPSRKVLGSFSDNKKVLRIFVRDAFSSQPLQVREGSSAKWGFMPNVFEFWPNVEAKAVANIANVLGKNGKLENIEIVEMSKDTGLWDSNFIIIGAQAQKCFDFYKNMEQVKYHMTGHQIYDNTNNKVVPRPGKYGFGLILKTKNPYGDKDSHGFLIGGYGTLGTEAASYYFKEHISDLGKKFGNKCFGVVVRALATSGPTGAQRLEKYDRIGD